MTRKVKLMFHATNNRLFVVRLLFFLTVFSPVSESVAVTFEPIYTDAPGVGFYDRTPLTEEHKAFLSAGDNPAQTLGEARRNAFETTLFVLGGFFIGDNIIRVEASFESLASSTLASASPSDFFILEPPNLINVDYPLAIPLALAETYLGQGLNRLTEADIEITFNENAIFYYGFQEERLVFGPGNTPFFFVAAHEMVHGMGFFHLIEGDGSLAKFINAETGELVKFVSIYDVNLFSGIDNDLLINLHTDKDRRDVMTSGERTPGSFTPLSRLLWDGTSNGENTYSCTRLVGESVKDQGAYPSVVDSDGRVRLYAPANYNEGSSVSHIAPLSLDLMEPGYGTIQHAAFTFGMLRDMGWELNRDNVEGFLPEEILEDCVADVSTGTPEPEPEPKPEPETPSTPRTSEGGGGCTIAGTESMPQNTIFNLFLMLSIMLSVSLRRSQEVLLSEKR